MRRTTNLPNTWLLRSPLVSKKAGSKNFGRPLRLRRRGIFPARRRRTIGCCCETRTIRVHHLHRKRLALHFPPLQPLLPRRFFPMLPNATAPPRVLLNARLRSINWQTVPLWRSIPSAATCSSFSTLLPTPLSPDPKRAPHHSKSLIVSAISPIGSVLRRAAAAIPQVGPAAVRRAAVHPVAKGVVAAVALVVLANS